MKVYLRTFGCRANQYDTEAVREMVVAAGHSVVASAAEADAAVFNSCAVTADAEADLRQAIRRAAREQPSLRTVVMGCASALDADRAPALSIRALPTVEQLVAGADLPAIAAALELEYDIKPLPNGDAPMLRTRVQTGARALLRVQDGCDEHCTFCATTIARGPNRSRSETELVREAAALAKRHAEIVITGIHIGTYGADIGSSLGVLMERLVREVPDVRFRLSSIEATEIDDRLVELLVGAPARVAPHVHAPLQSGSDRVLRRMGRHWYTAAQYVAAIDRLASRMSILGLGADVIAGFPGETSEDHAETRALIARLPFTYLHVFPFSMRPGTGAERLGQALPTALISERAAELRSVASNKSADYTAARVGGTADVVVVRGGPTPQAMSGDYLDVDVEQGGRARGERFSGTLRRGARGRLAVA